MGHSQKSHPLVKSGTVNYKIAVWEQSAIRTVLKLAAYLSIFITLAIVAILLGETVGFFKEISMSFRM